MLNLHVTFINKCSNFKHSTVVDNELLARGIENCDAGSYASLSLCIFLSPFFRHWKFEKTHFTRTIQSRIFRFGAVMDSKLLYYGIENEAGWWLLLVPFIHLFSLFVFPMLKKNDLFVLFFCKLFKLELWIFL